MITRWVSILLFTTLIFVGVNIKNLTVAYVSLIGFVVAAVGIFSAITSARWPR